MDKGSSKYQQTGISGYDHRHYLRTEQYLKDISRLYDSAMKSFCVLAKKLTVQPDKPFSFNDYPSAKKVASGIITNLTGNMQTVIESGGKAEWLAACKKNDVYLAQILKTSKLTKEQAAQYFDHNLKALETFQTRKVNGMDLSKRIWQYTDQFKTQIELGLDIGLGEGRSAQELSRDLRKNLVDPDNLFRKVKDKHGILHLSKNAAAYHPGQGKYRSSYKNAMRLTRTEVNMAYRESEWTRWQTLDFVIGIKVSLSNNHTIIDPKTGKARPFTDICDELQGMYPKTFKFVGWHPQCRCNATPVLKTMDEFDDNELSRLKAAFKGEKYKAQPSKDTVTDVPEKFTNYIDSIAEQSTNWKSQPYYIRDNFKGGKIEGGLKLDPIVIPEHVAPVPEIILPVEPPKPPKPPKPVDPLSKKGLEEQFTKDEVKMLFEAYDNFNTKISGLPIEKQAEKIAFEINWLKDNGKYSTSSKLADMLKRDLPILQAKIAIKTAISKAGDLYSTLYGGTDKKLNKALKDLETLSGVNENKVNLPKLEAAIKKVEDVQQEIVKKAEELQQELNKKLFSKDIEFFNQGDKHDISKHWTTEEKDDVQKQRQELIDCVVKNGGNPRNSDVQFYQQKLANTIIELGIKYVGKQADIKHIGFESTGKGTAEYPFITNAQAKKAYEEYIKAKQIKEYYGSPVGGKFDNRDYVDSLKEYVNKVNANGGNITHEATLSARYFAGQSFINQYVLGSDHSLIISNPALKQTLDNYIPALSYAINKLPRYNGISYRGINANGASEIVASALESFKTGQPFIHKTVMSSSTRLSTADNFGTDVTFKVYGRSGHYGDHYSVYHGEKEVLFRAGSRFKILDIHQATTDSDIARKGSWSITMEEIL